MRLWRIVWALVVRWLAALTVAWLITPARGEETSCSGDEVGKPICPSLFLLGAQKAGTTSLQKWFRSNVRGLIQPTIRRNGGALSVQKEVHFFDKRYENGVDWYLSHYPLRKDNDEVAMDSTPGYFRHSYVPARMKAVIGMQRPQFILVLRDPIRRAFAWYKHVMTANIYTEAWGRFDMKFTTMAYTVTEPLRECVLASSVRNTFLECARDNPRWADTLVQVSGTDRVVSHIATVVELFADGLYAYILEEWFKYFSPEQFCIAIFEDLVISFSREFKNLEPCLSHLGLQFSRGQTSRMKRFNIGKCSRCERLETKTHASLRKYLIDNLFRDSNALLRELMAHHYGRQIRIWEDD